MTLAGKGSRLSEGQDWEQPLSTIHPNTFSATRHIDALHIYESGEIIAQDLEGNRSSIKSYNQPQEVNDAIQHGHLMSLLGHFNLYVTKPGKELKIQLMGGLKGGGNGPSTGGGGGSRYTPYQPILTGRPRHPDENPGKWNPRTGEVIERPNIVITPLYTSNYRPPQEIGIGKPFTKPNRHTTQGPSLTSRPYTHITDREPKKISTSGNTLEEQKKTQDIKIARTQMTTALTDVTTKYPQSLLSNMSKRGVSKEFFPLWKAKRGQTFGDMSHLMYGYNIENNAAVVNKKNGLSYPIFIDDRQASQTNSFLPEGYKATYSHDKGIGDFILHRYEGNILLLIDHIIGVPNDKHNPVRAAFHKNHNELNVRLTLGHGSYKSYQTLFIRTTYPELLKANETQKQQLGRMLRDLDGVLYNSKNPQPGRFGGFISRIDVPPHMLADIEAMKSFIGRNENGTINSSALALRPAVRNINGHIGMEDPYLKNGLVYSLFKEDRVQDGAYLPQGFVDKDRYFETVGLAITNALGKGVKELWCNTIGVCDVEAVPLALPALGFVGEQIGLGALIGIGTTYLGDKAVQYSKGATQALGFAFNNMLKNAHLPQEYVVCGGAKILAGIIDDSIKIAQTLKTPIFKGTPLELLVTEGVIGKPKMNITPLPDDKIDITLTTPIFDNWRQKERLIHMQVTLKDIEFVEMMGKKKANLGDARPTDNGRGVKWDDAPEGNPGKVSNGIRIMKGLGENAPFPSQVGDYVKVIRGGKMLDENGVEVKSGDNGFHAPSDNPRSHIKKDIWRQWRHSFHPTDPRGGLK